VILNNVSIRWAPIALASSALLLAGYARGAWALGFVALVPWLLVLRQSASWRAALVSGLAMSMAFVVAVFPWFASAISAYTGLPEVVAFVLLLIAAPLLQPQWIVFALARLASDRAPVAALAAACAYVCCEWLYPKLLGDTLGHGLAPATTLRQIADVAGAAGISFALLLSNEALAMAIARYRSGIRHWLPPWLVVMVIPAAMYGYGQMRLETLRAQMSDSAPSLAIGMIQSGIVDYERRRADVGSYAVVREVLDTHFQMSQSAVQQHGLDALLWSETVYPTPFGHPRSEQGALFDDEIRAFVEASGATLLFGSYDVDAGGEYNAAALVEPGQGLIGYYRKTHPFPLTEYVPAWLDGPRLRALLPWAGSWQRGQGARVLPLRARDGRELNVLPMICLDSVVPGLAIDGARLGAQAIISLSNDAWFASAPLGAELHLAVASFRSIETRLPQLRVTTNGITAFIDPSGEVLARTAMGDRAVLAGAVPIRTPPPTLMVRLGDWFGAAALGVLALLAVLRAASARRTAPSRPQPLDASVLILSAWQRSAVVVFRSVAAGGLMWLAWRMATRDGWQVNALVQIEIFLAAVVLPLLLAGCVVWWSTARLAIEGGDLVIRQRHRVVHIPMGQIATLTPWQWPFPGPGWTIEFVSGRRFGAALVHGDLPGLLSGLGFASTAIAEPRGWRYRFAAQRWRARHRWLDHGLIRFALFPLLAAIPAFRLHQYIAFGGAFGEYYTYGLVAYAKAFGIWWLAWSLGLMLFAAVLRCCADIVALAIAGGAARTAIEWSVRVAFYLLAPALLIVRALWG
jgi:apolipoprotein N-acyltransferase